MRLTAIALCGSLLAHADNDVARRSRGDLLKLHSVMTFSDLSVFVDPTGNDANSCAGTGVNACATFQGALNRLPRLLHHRATLTAACGSYQGFVVANFTQDNSWQSVTGGLLIQGTLANSTLASGPATGTATSGTAGVTSTFGTLTMTGANWTVNDLKGRFLVRTGGTGAATANYPVISSNTVDTLTIVGTWTAPDATSTFAIQEPCTQLTSGIPTIPTAVTNGAGSSAFINFESNNAVNSGTTAGISLRYLKLTHASSGGMNVVSGSAPAFTNVQSIMTSSTAGTVKWTNSGFGTLRVNQSYSVYGVALTALGIGTHLFVVNGPVSSNGSLFENGERLVADSALQLVTFGGIEAKNLLRGMECDFGCTLTVLNSRLGCDGETGEWAIEVGERHDGATSGAVVHVTSTDFNNCYFMFQQGGAFLQVNSFTGNALGSVIKLLGGGKAVFVNSGIGGTSSGDSIVLGSNGVTSFNFADIDGQGACVSALVDGSSVCKN